jgi:hypothetical protein
MTLDEMTVDKMPVDEMTVDRMSCCPISILFIGRFAKHETHPEDDIQGSILKNFLRS